MPSNTTRLGLTRPVGSDPADVPASFTTLTNQLDSKMLPRARGTYASRPTAGVEDRLYYATDRKLWYHDDGSGWRAISSWSLLAKSDSGLITGSRPNGWPLVDIEDTDIPQLSITPPVDGIYDLTVGFWCQQDSGGTSLASVHVTAQTDNDGPAAATTLPVAGDGSQPKVGASAKQRGARTAGSPISMSMSVFKVPGDSRPMRIRLLQAYLELVPVQVF